MALIQENSFTDQDGSSSCQEDLSLVEDMPDKSGPDHHFQEFSYHGQNRTISGPEDHATALIPAEVHVHGSKCQSKVFPVLETIYRTHWNCVRKRIVCKTAQFLNKTGCSCLALHGINVEVF